jgi:cysteine sulfinate desulfinase/cysteine desulfurase-like protein
LSGLSLTIEDIIINTPTEASLPNLVSVSVRYIEGESVMLMLDDDGIAVATRSACATGSLRASHVLLSIGRSHADAQGTLVLTLASRTPNQISITFWRRFIRWSRPCATSLPFTGRKSMHLATDRVYGQSLSGSVFNCA